MISQDLFNLTKIQLNNTKKQKIIRQQQRQNFYRYLLLK